MNHLLLFRTTGHYYVCVCVRLYRILGPMMMMMMMKVFSAETLIGSIGFYYRETCGHCQLVDDGGECDALEKKEVCVALRATELLLNP